MTEIIIADAKFEFGLDENGELVLADELLTPDSSRMWDLAIGLAVPQNVMINNICGTGFWRIKRAAKYPTFPTK